MHEETPIIRPRPQNNGRAGFALSTYLLYTVASRRHRAISVCATEQHRIADNGLAGSCTCPTSYTHSFGFHATSRELGYAFMLYRSTSTDDPPCSFQRSRLDNRYVQWTGGNPKKGTMYQDRGHLGMKGMVQLIIVFSFGTRRIAKSTLSSF